MSFSASSISRTRSPARSPPLSPVHMTTDRDSPLSSTLLSDRDRSFKENQRPPISPDQSTRDSQTMSSDPKIADPKLAAHGSVFMAVMNTHDRQTPRGLSGGFARAHLRDQPLSSLAERAEHVDSPSKPVVTGSLFERTLPASAKGRLGETARERPLSASIVERRYENQEPTPLVTGSSTSHQGSLFPRTDRNAGGLFDKHARNNAGHGWEQPLSCSRELGADHTDSRRLVPGSLAEKTDTDRARSFGSRESSERVVTPPKMSDEAVINLSERQKEWDRAAANADQKQAELAYYQWNLIREQMNTFSKELLSLRSEIKGLRPMASRITECETQLAKQCEAMATLNKSVNLQKDVEEKLSFAVSDLSSTLTGALEDETRHRAVEMQDLSRQVSQTRESCEEQVRGQESRLSRATQNLEGQVMPALKELRLTLQQETNERILSFDKLSDKLERAQLRELRDKLEREARDRLAATERLEKSCNELGSKLDMEATKRTRLSDEAEKRHFELVHRFEHEARIREEAHTKISTDLASVQGQVENEIRDRNMEVREVSDRLGLLTDALDSEIKDSMSATSELERVCSELRQSLDAEIKSRTSATSELERSWDELRQALDQDVRRVERAQSNFELEARTRKEAIEQALPKIAALSDSFEAEKRVRREAEERAGTGFRESCKRLSDSLSFEIEERKALEALLAKQCKDLQAGLAKEASDRGLHIEKLDRAHAVLTTQVRADAEERMQAKAEATRGVNSVIQKVDAAILSMRDSIRKETVDRTATCEDLSRSVSSLKVELDVEARARQEGDAEIVQGVHERSMALEQAQMEWERADVSLRNQMVACQHEIASERSDRVDEVSILRSSLQAEATERAAADELGVKTLHATARRFETTIESMCDLLWAKMGTMAERFITFGREWRETSPTAELLQQMHSASLHEARGVLQPL